ncbi:ATP-binding protein [Bacillus sp. S/N-304-OC-R1]|uniref:ATP-binding protein n=1 Tax=Bacillus sp. S/N-304-OC-R1 TaxID=2758034 RepID=UPI001C8E10A1|nr:ATP-binding protein [Bacillus sp. S/N-304-OC-R1]MBY0123536.1 ATP-binding protein [Bacillus sp. S/N-304-OC-R1]
MTPYIIQYFFIYLFISLSSIFIGLFIYSLPKRKHPYLLYFGLFLAAILVNLIGIWQLPASVKFPSFIKYASYSAGPFFLLFYEQIFGQGFKKINRRLWQLHLLCWAIIMFFSLLSIIDLEDLFLPYSLLNISSVLYIAIVTITKAYSGNKDAKTFTFGLICFISTFFYDLTQAIKIANYAPSQTFIWGLLIFTGSLTVILLKRFRAKGSDFIYEAFTFQHNPLDLKMKADSMVMHTLKNEINRLLYLNERSKRLTQTFDASSADPLRKNFDAIDETLHHMNNMIQAIKKTDDIRLSLQKQSINEVILDTVNSFKIGLEHNTIEFIIDLPIHIEAEVDPLHLKECIINLLSNSAEAIDHQNGKIHIQLQQKDQDAIIEVRDNGKGIHREHLDDVITPLYTTKKSVSHYGIGLYYVYFVISKHGGTLSIPNSEIGKGTTIRIQLPTKSKAESFWSVRTIGKNKSHAG